MRRCTGVALLFSWLFVACDPSPTKKTGGGPVGGSVPAASGNPKKAPPLATASVQEATAPAAAQPRLAEQPALPYGSLSTRWKLHEVQDLGPAAPTTATAEGVLFVTLDDRLLLAKRKAAIFEPREEPAEAFAKYGRGPAITQTHAYWIAQRGQLLRASRTTPAVDVIVAGARSGTRVSAQTAAGRDVVAFIADVDENPRAYVWSDGEAPLQLSEDASTASSVQLLPGATHPRALVLEGRTGMSPVHLRTVRVTKKHMNLAPDEVIWIGPGAQPLTELAILGAPNGRATAFLAVSREVTQFGLGYFGLDKEGALEAPPQWRVYPNGIDPAPVAAAGLCAGNYAFFVVPTESAPRSPQELRVARLDEAGRLGEEEILARSRAFNDISVAGAPGGAVVSWTADRRTWAVFAGCP